MSIVNSRIGSQVRTHQPDLINIYDSSIGDESKIATFVEIGGADIGDRCNIGAYVKVSPKCKVGNDVKIGHNSVLMQDVVLGNHVTIGNCCVIATNVHIGDNAIIDDTVCVTQDVMFGEHVTKEGPPQRSKYGGIDPSPAISSDHPARAAKADTPLNSKIEWRGGKPFHTTILQATPGEPMQLRMEDLFTVTSPEDISELFNKAHACKGKCMEEPKSPESDPLGFDFFK